jgi:hypothetical protein
MLPALYGITVRARATTSADVRRKDEAPRELPPLAKPFAVTGLT